MCVRDFAEKITTITRETVDILNALPFYVLLIDEHHKILFANEATIMFLASKKCSIPEV